MALNGFRDQRRHFLEYFTTLLDKQYIRFTNTRLVGPVQKAEIVADIVRKRCFQASTKNFKPLVWLSIFFTLHQNGGTGITKNKVTVALAEVQMTRANFRANHQHGARSTAFDRVNRCLQPERSRAAGHVHVVGETVNAQSALHLDRKSVV